jgi:CHASE3 domain sensor protein
MALSYWIERASRGLGERGRARLMAASFGLLFLVAIATSVSAILSARADRWVAHTLEVQAQASELLSAMQDAENEYLRYILTGDPAWLKSLDVSQRDVGNAFMRLKTLTADNPTQQQRLERLKLLLDDRYSLIRQSVQMVSDGKRDDAAALVKTDQDRKLTDGIRINLTDVSMEEEQLLERRREAAANQGQLLFGLVGFSLLGVAVLAGLVGLSTRRYLTDLRDEAARRERAEQMLQQTQKMDDIG